MWPKKKEPGSFVLLQAGGSSPSQRVSSPPIRDPSSLEDSRTWLEALGLWEGCWAPENPAGVRQQSGHGPAWRGQSVRAAEDLCLQIPVRKSPRFRDVESLA